jgi:GNAT superfamily N-acetyltransferase
VHIPVVSDVLEAQAVGAERVVPTTRLLRADLIKVLFGEGVQQRHGRSAHLPALGEHDIKGWVDVKTRAHPFVIGANSPVSNQSTAWWLACWVGGWKLRPNVDCGILPQHLPNLMVTIRRATVHDADAACKVVRRSIIELCALDHGGDQQRLDSWLANKTPSHFSQWITSDAAIALVAEREGAVEGFALLGREGKLHLLYISPDARFSGVSTALLNAVETEAAALGVTRLELESSITARRFYESRGYVADDREAAQGNCKAMVKVL